MKELFEKLVKSRGKIVLSADCTQLEIAQAAARGDFYVDENSIGFVYLPGISEQKVCFKTN